MFKFIQLISLLLGLFFVYKSYQLISNKKESMFYFLLWSVIGTVLVVFSFFYEEILDASLLFMGMSSRVNLLFSGTALLCLFLIFMMFKEVQNNKQMINRLNRELSILKNQKNEDK